MPEVYFATTNKGKVKTLRDALMPHGIEVVHVNIELPEPRSDDLRLIACEKVRHAYQHTRMPTVAMDAGFYIHALGGFPKSFVNFALGTIDLEGLLKLTEGRPRDCEFRNCLAYLDGQRKEPVYFESCVQGLLAEGRRGTLRQDSWSRLHLVFIPAGYSKTLAEMTPAEYAGFRQERARDSFSTQFADWFVEYCQNPKL